MNRIVARLVRRPVLVFACQDGGFVCKVQYLFRSLDYLSGSIDDLLSRFDDLVGVPYRESSPVSCSRAPVEGISLVVLELRISLLGVRGAEDGELTMPSVTADQCPEVVMVTFCLNGRIVFVVHDVVASWVVSVGLGQICRRGHFLWRGAGNWVSSL
jgi:hypothetical protein